MADQHPSFDSRRFASQPLSRRESAVLLTVCALANKLKKRHFGAICMPRDLDMKSLMITPRGRCRRSNLPNALRAAARAILDEAGPDGVSLRETARCVGVSATAVYRHFTNKQHLLASVAAEGFRELATAMKTDATGSDPLGGVGLAYFEFALRKRGL